MIQFSNWPSKFLFFKRLKRILHHDCLFGPNMALRRSAWEKVKDEVCLEDKQVHEDIDLSIHLASYGNIRFDKKLIASSSFRRYKKLKTYFEYPYRDMKTIRRHKKTVIEIQSRKLVKKVYLRSRTIVRHLQDIPNQL
ncbi:MAG TPA: hypothetical protein VLF89_10290 [Candidatus Saccharimonadales bacterium]|nr:hypothetical protein [Candidatus Saccharimonadales bacterium]